MVVAAKSVTLAEAVVAAKVVAVAKVLFVTVVPVATKGLEYSGGPLQHVALRCDVLCQADLTHKPRHGLLGCCLLDCGVVEAFSVAACSAAAFTAALPLLLCRPLP